MANAASTIEIELEIRQAINRLDRLQRELTQSTQSFNKAAQATRKFEGAINKAKAGLVAFFAAISVQKLAQLSDAMTQFENRVKLATNSLVQQLAVQQQLFQVAQKTALPLEDVGQLYSRLRIAAEQLGASQRDLINLTETVGLALKASGTSAASAQGALLQLGQALNSPRVQAEEFNSLIDGMPNLLREVEKQLGLTAGGLKKFVTDGQLSNKKFFDAILASQKALTQQANSSASTIEQANQRVANSFTSLIGAIDDKLGASKFFTGFIDGLASGIDKLSNFLGLTTQATGGGGGGANLDEVIKEQTGLITDLEASFEGLSIYATTAIIGFSSLFEDANLTLEKYIKNVETFVEGYASYYDRIEAGEIPGFPALQIDPKTQEQLFLSAEQARKEFELIFKFIAQGFKAFENLNGEAQKYLTYLERITNYLSEQLRLLELSEENANRTAGAIVSGVSGAGPNASRAANIAQSKRPEEAAAKLILSNEKVAAAIEEYFTLLFDTIDPLIDILGDLISAINRLIGALAKGIGDGIQSTLDQLGVGQDSYLFGGGFARDFEQFSYDLSGGMFGVNNREDIGLSRDEYNAYSLGISGLSGQDTIDELLRNLSSVGLTGVLEGEDYKKVIEEINALARKGDATDQQRAQLLKNAAAAQTLLFNQIEEQAKQISNSEALSLLEEINQRGIERNEIDQIRINYSREIKEVSENLILTEEDQIRVITALEEARNREIEAIERQQQLLDVQTGGNELTKILDTLEDTFDRIIDLVEDLKDQTLNLLFSDKSLAPASVRFDTAATRYQELLAAALDPDATEGNVKEFQSFVDTYLQSAQDVFKSSSQYQNIFDSVLADIEEVSNFVSIAMPISEIESVKKQLVEVAEEFGIGIEEVIAGLDNLSRSLIYQAVISNVPVSAFVDSEQSDLVIEAVVTAIADPVNSDTQIEAVVTAIMAAGSDTVIEAIVKAVQAPGSDTTIEAVVNAIAASSSDLQIEAIVKAVQAPGSDTTIEAVVNAIAASSSDLQIEAIVKAVQAPGSTTTISTIVQAILDAKNSDTIVETPVKAIIDEANSSLVVDAVVTAVSGQELEIDAIVTAVQATGSDTVIEAVVTAVEDKNLSDTEIEAIVTAAMATGSNTTILAVVNAILDAAKSDLTIEALVSAIAASGSDTQIEALVTAIAKSGSDTQIEALVTAIMASGSDTEIEAIVKAIAASGSDTQIEALVTAIMASGSDTEIEAVVRAIMASGSDTQIEAIVSAVASNTPVISAIVSAVAANTPVVTPTVTLDDSEITSAFSSLSQTLENSINRLIESIRLQELKSQAAASGIFTTGGYAKTYATNMAGGGTTNFISGSLITDLRPSGDTTQYDAGLQPGFQYTGNLSTDQIFQALLNRARILNPEVLSKPYYVLRATNASNSSRVPYLDAFDDLNAAQTFYDNALGNGYYYYKWNYGPVQKYGFRQGGLVPSAMDTIPAMLSPGEYILSPETVKRYGVSNLNSLNSGDTAALNATSDPEVKRLLAELIVAVRENDTQVNVYTDMKGQTKAGIEEFRSELRERTRRQGDQYVPARYI